MRVLGHSFDRQGRRPETGRYIPAVQETPYRREDGYAERYRDARFATGHGPRTDRLERRAIARLLAAASWEAGPWLDLPCGAGRLSDALPGPVVQVDRALAMVTACDGHWPRACASGSALPFADGSFAGALCLRLLQHIPGGAERRRILAELRRVSRGPLIVSFFDACSLQHARRLLRRATGKPRSGRSAVLRWTFRDDLVAAGLRPVRMLPLRRFVAEQTLVLAMPAAAST